jgi:hypothetical protein
VARTLARRDAGGRSADVAAGEEYEWCEQHMHALQWPHHTRHAANKYSSGQGSAAAQATRQAEKCMLMLPAMSAEVWVWVV